MNGFVVTEDIAQIWSSGLDRRSDKIPVNCHKWVIISQARTSVS